MADKSQTGYFALGATDGNCLEAWAPPETVENAHDLGNDNAPYAGRLDNNITNAPARAPDANR